MDTYTLERTALPQLTFSGRLLVQSCGADEDDATQGRVHDVAVYETDDAEFIVEVRYRSPFASELSDRFVDALKSIDEVEAVLSLYDATERLDSSLFKDQDAQKRQTVVSTLLSRFDRQVLKVLEALRSEKCV